MRERERERERDLEGMEMVGNVYGAHCLVLAYPGQGHINPMMEFSKRLEHKGVKVTMVITKSISHTMNKEVNSIVVETISDGYDEGGVAEAESIHAYLESFRRVGSQTLIELIEKLSNSGCPVDCVVYDPFLPWALDIAKKFGLVGAMFSLNLVLLIIYITMSTKEYLKSLF
jgi:pathogen-inducible salicylic acid glucosyltransferase